MHGVRHSRRPSWRCSAPVMFLLFCFIVYWRISAAPLPPPQNKPLSNALVRRTLPPDPEADQVEYPEDAFRQTPGMPPTTGQEKQEAAERSSSEKEEKETGTSRPSALHHHKEAKKAGEEQWDREKPLQWKARSLYLPIAPESKRKFLEHNTKQQLRWESTMKTIWNAFDVTNCLKEVPECEFFEAIEAKAMLRKCCVEHMKMKASLFYLLDAAEASGLKLFLDSGSLLSAMRDGGDTLLPWETDIDLGVIGVQPSIVSGPVKKYQQEWKKRNQNLRNHLFVECKKKVSKNVSRNGMCMDAHYVYYATTKGEAEADTSRVEVWPFWPESGKLIHPTRKRLTVNESLVLPLSFGGKCRLWGRPMWCPNDATGYLDHEYTPDWRWPKTIHWGKTGNVPAWKSGKVLRE